MGDCIIRVENLGKLYRIGASQPRYNTIRESLHEFVGAQIHRLRAAFSFPNPLDSQRSNKDNTIWALRNISFEVKQGEVTGIIGRNGAGKSTLLKILSRVTKPTEGAVDLYGRVSSLLEVGTGFHPELTGRENIFLNGAVLGMRRAEILRKFDEIVAFAEVERFLDTPVKHYSSGMYLRLAFAVAAHLEPEILLVDEVLAVGDATFQKKCLGKMGDVAKGGRTVLFVSHNMPAIKRFCTSAYLLDRGRITMGGDAATVVDAYYRVTLDTGDSPPEARDVPDGTVRFVGWCTRTSAAEPYSCYAGDPCAIQFRLAVRRRVEAANFGIAFWATDGTLVWAMRSLDHGGECMPLQEGLYTAEFAVPGFPLNSGLYQILVSANDSDEGTLDAWYAQPPLRILPKDERGLPPQWQGILDISGRFTLIPIGEGKAAKKSL